MVQKVEKCRLEARLSNISAYHIGVCGTLHLQPLLQAKCPVALSRLPDSPMCFQYPEGYSIHFGDPEAVSDEEEEADSDDE